MIAANNTKSNKRRMGRCAALVSLVLCVGICRGESCLNVSMNKTRVLTYADGTTTPVRLPFSSWASGQFSAQVLRILLEEIMGYESLFIPVNSTVEVINLVAGCGDANADLCNEVNADFPSVHVSPETRLAGIIRVSQINENYRPSLLSVMDYKTTDTLFLWSEVVDKAFSSSPAIGLFHYKFYNSTMFKPYVFFNHWEKMLDVLPASSIKSCYDYAPASTESIQLDQYKTYTGDLEYNCFQDVVWISPACRHNTTLCVPVMVQYLFFQMMQISFWLDMPIAMIRVASGTPYFDQTYFEAIRRGHFLFEWYTPDDNLVDQLGRLPIQLFLPATNVAERANGLYRTGNSDVNPLSYAWRQLSRVDPKVGYLVSNFNFFQGDLDKAMVLSYRLKHGGNASSTAGALPSTRDATRGSATSRMDLVEEHTAEDDPRSTSQVSWLVACNWVKENEARWQRWIPAYCAAGSYSNPSMLSECLPCPPGAFCLGGFDSPLPCPPAHYCPANSSAPTPCPSGRQTGQEAVASSVESCTDCTFGKVLVSGACVSLLSVVLGTALPACFLAMMAVVVAMRVWAHRPHRSFNIRASEVVIPRNAEVLGYGWHGPVVKAYYRGTAVAVKRLRPSPRLARITSLEVARGRNSRASSDLNQGSEVGFDIESDVWADSSQDSSRGCSCRFFFGALMADARRCGRGCLNSARLREERESELPYERYRLKSLAHIRHPSVTTIMGIASVSTDGAEARPCLVMELMDLGSLQDILRNRTFPLTPTRALRFLRAAAQGMRFLHTARPPIVHGNLKSTNVLIDASWTAKISDFGQTEVDLELYEADPAAMLWLPPEILRLKPSDGRRRAPSSVAADVYAFGVLVHKVLTRALPFVGRDLAEAVEAVRSRGERIPCPPGCSVQAGALLAECTEPGPGHRPGFKEICRRLSAVDSRGFTSPAFAPDEPEEASVGERASEVGPSLEAAVVLASAYPPAARLPAAGGEEGFDALSLLRRVFPPAVAEALLRGDRPAPERKELVTIFFSDIVGFTSLSSTMPAEKVSDMLDRFYAQLDALAEVHGIFKIETIGDAYLCATNMLGTQDDSHAIRMARFGIEAVAAAERIPVDPRDPSKGFLRLRAGIHSGPCTACVLGGLRHPKYTLLGDTVNTASRMESTSEPGRAQCSSRTAALLREQEPQWADWHLAARGLVEVKGKGSMSTYWILPDPTPELDLAAAALAPTARGSSGPASPCRMLGPQPQTPQACPEISMHNNSDALGGVRHGSSLEAYEGGFDPGSPLGSAMDSPSVRGLGRAAAKEAPRSPPATQGGGFG